MDQLLARYIQDISHEFKDSRILTSLYYSSALFTSRHGDPHVLPICVTPSRYQSESPEMLETTVEQIDLVSASVGITPSVSPQELLHYEKLRQQFASNGSQMTTEISTGEIGV